MSVIHVLITNERIINDLKQDYFERFAVSPLSLGCPLESDIIFFIHKRLRVKNFPVLSMCSFKKFGKVPVPQNYKAPVKDQI